MTWLSDKHAYCRSSVRIPAGHIGGAGGGGPLATASKKIKYGFVRTARPFDVLM